MKKNVLLFVLSGLLMTSCLKDGLHDFDALNGDLSFQGEISPTLGIPIGHGEATIFDMLKMVQLTEAELEVSENDILTITYDSSFSFQVDLENSKHKSSGSKDPEIVHVSRNSIEGVVNIDLFDNIHLLDTADIEVDSLLIYLRAHVKAASEDADSTLAAMNRYHVLVYYDQLNLTVLGQDDTVYDIVTLYNQPGDSLSVNTLVQGEDVLLFNNTDISTAINKRPKQIRYTARMNIAFTPEFFATNISEEDFIADSIGIKKVNVDAYLKARFPVSAYINNVQYNVDINMNVSTGFDQLTIDSSMLFIECLNGIPLEFLLQSQLIDENNNVLCDLLDPVHTTIAGADVALNPVTNLYTSTGQKRTVVQIPVTKSVFDNVMLANRLRLYTGLNTSNTGNPLRNRATVQSTDLLSLRVWAKIKPSYTLDMTMGGSDSTSNEGKGGVR